MTGSGSQTGRRFLFGEDFRAPPPDPPSPADQQAAQEEAYRRGLAEGRRAAEAAIETRLAAAIERLAGQALALAGAIDAERAAVEEEAIAFFGALARTLAGRALAADPLGAVAETAREAFRHLRGVPHLVLRVAPDLVERVEALVQREAREGGFEGRVIVLGDDEAAGGDTRINWADGGIVRDEAALRRAVSRALAGSPWDDIAS